MDLNWIRSTGVILTILWVTLVQGQPQYEVQVQGPIKFTYRPREENRIADGNCCTMEAGSSCPTVCDNLIILCFREIQHPTSDTNLTSCPLGGMTFTPPTMNTDIITFNATMQATTTTYIGRFQLLYSILALPRRTEVESGRISLNETIQNRSSPPTTQQFGGVRIVLITGGLRVVCREGYFGPDCGCTPRDDSTGHFTCDVNGTIVCLPGYQNTATNCVEESEPITNPETITTSTTTITTPAPTPSTTNVTVNTMETFITDSSTENGEDIVPIVAGGVAGVLVVLLLILIVNIVLVAVALKIKYMKNKQESMNEEHIVMGANPVYAIKNSRPDDHNDDYETVQ